MQRQEKQAGAGGCVGAKQKGKLEEKEIKEDKKKEETGKWQRMPVGKMEQKGAEDTRIPNFDLKRNTSYHHQSTVQQRSTFTLVRHVGLRCFKSNVKDNDCGTLLL